MVGRLHRLTEPLAIQYPATTYLIIRCCNPTALCRVLCIVVREKNHTYERSHSTTIAWSENFFWLRTNIIDKNLLDVEEDEDKEIGSERQHP